MRAIGWILAVLGGLCLAAWGLSWVVLVQLVKMTEYPMALHGLGGAGAVMIGLWLFLDWGSLSSLGKDQTVGREAMSGLLMFVALLLVGLFNVIGVRYDKRWDLTSNKKFTLSEQSITVAKGLAEKVQVIAFFPKGSTDEQNFRELMKGYTEASSIVEVSFHDPMSDNILAQSEKITSPYGEVIIRVGEHEDRITNKFDEESVTNAIVKATATTSHTLCAVAGHGEGGADDTSGPEGFGGALEKLTKQNYVVSTVQLLQSQPKPSECEVLFIGGPKTDFMAAELDRVGQYVAAGGKLIVLLDPLVTPNLAADMARYGVKVGTDVVIEADPYLQVAQGGPTFVVLPHEAYGAHPITEKLADAAILPLTRSVAPGAPISGLTVTELAHTSEQSWAETNLADIQTNPPNPDPGADTIAKVSVAVAVEVTDPAAVAETSTVGALPAMDGAVAIAAPPPQVEKLEKKAGGKVVVFGDSDFGTNQFAPNGSNTDLLLGTVGWMVDDKNQITIHANEAKVGTLTVGTIEAAVAVMVAMLGVPGLAVLGAVGTFLRRRNR